MTAADRLNAMQQRCDAATEGPWECRAAEPFRGQTGYSIRADGSGSGVILFGGYGPRGGRQEADATLAAEARTDLPATIAALRAVLRIHAPLWTPSRGHYCQECGTPLTDDAPDCSTVRAITEALT